MIGKNNDYWNHPRNNRANIVRVWSMYKTDSKKGLRTLQNAQHIRKMRNIIMELSDEPQSRYPITGPASFDAPEQQVPEGLYCYSVREFPSADNNYKMKINPCPFWGRDGTQNFQQSGYCLLTGIKDWEEDRLSLLWDMVKECEHNPGNLDDHVYDYDGE